MQKKLGALKVQDENNRNGATRREGWGEGRRVEICFFFAQRFSRVRSKTKGKKKRGVTN